jgi:Xaa-Pro aminopeptidase
LDAAAGSGNHLLLLNSAGMNFSLRLKNLRQQLEPSKISALLVSHLPNIQYSCGFSGSAGFLAVSEGEAVLFTDSRYKQQAREEVKGAKIVIARDAVINAVAEWMAGRGRKSKRFTLGIEADHLRVAERKRLADLLPSGIRLKSAPPLVERARMIKDDEELQRIRAAVQLGASLFDHALQVIKPGVKETEVAAEMEYMARRAGAEAMSFPTIIASGARSALPHGRASEQPIATGAFVVCDFGVILANYCSDETRTVWLGQESKEARGAYQAVKEAQQAAIAAVRPGAMAGAVDAAARKTLAKAGLGRYFTHSTGHGVGLEIHEAPRVAAAQTEILKPGMVITIEPGVYFPGKWGIRIEDMVAVTARGCEVLTPTSKDFVAVSSS